MPKTPYLSLLSSAYNIDFSLLEHVRNATDQKQLDSNLCCHKLNPIEQNVVEGTFDVN